MRDERDITRAVEAHADTVKRVCAVYFHDRPECDDAFQETFIKYARCDRSFESEEHRKAWLITVATNTCKDFLKRAETRNVSLEDLDEDGRQFPDAQQSERGKADELLEALGQLEEKYRIVLYLKYYEGYSAVEIAEMLNMPENTAYTNLSRGREKLKEVLTRG